MLDLAFRTPFDLQVEFLRAKLRLPSATWRDLWQAAHDRAFVVAGAMQADLLADLHAAVVKAAAEGRGIADFRQEFAALVARHGWSGWTGQGSKAGEAWRTRVIYQTNMATSYAAGRWAQINDPALAEFRPYIQYHHSDSVAHPRPQHLAWDGLVLAKDHPFWQTHAPPNGWGCACWLTAAGPQDYARAQAAGKSAPPPGWESNAGIDKGWAYNPGASRAAELQQFARDKAAKLPGPIGADFLKEVARLAQAPAAPFIEQQTAKACAEWAMRNNLADFADYTGVKPDVANAWNKGLFDSLREFPELRKNQTFTGSAQAQFARYAEVRRADYAASLVAKGMTPENARKWAEQRILVPKVEGKAFAQSWGQQEARGIAINKKWGGDPAAFGSQLNALEASGWFPPGCNTYRSILDHEIGHQLDALLQLRFDNEIVLAYKEAVAKGMKDTVSGYAEHRNNPIAEFIAECWSESCNNPTPRDAARTVAGIIRARYRSRFPA